MKEKISHLALISVGLLSSVILLFIVVEYLLPVILPFIIAWLIAALTVAPARRMASKGKIPERVLRLMLALFFTFAIVTVAGIIIWQVIQSTMRFVSDLGTGNRFYDIIMALFSYEIPFITNKIPEEITAGIKTIIGNALSSVFSALANFATSFAAVLPRIFFVLLVTLISLVYFSLDYDRISAFVKSVLPEKIVSGISALKKGIFMVIGKYLLSYSLILLITFSLMFFGFTILRVEHALLVAFFVALLDILPVIGVGTVLIPWSIIELTVGHNTLGISLIVLFVVNAIVRQLVEPKIVGKNLNIHPLVTLVLLYVGYSLFGLLGLIMLPVVAVSISAVLKSNSATEIG